MLDFQESFSQYAVFGPYGNLCVTSLHSCTTGFTIVFWIKMEYNCTGYVLSTRDNSNTPGIDIRCDNTGLFYSITKRYGSHTVDVGDSTGRWIHVAFQADIYLDSLKCIMMSTINTQVWLRIMTYLIQPAQCRVSCSGGSM